MQLTPLDHLYMRDTHRLVVRATAVAELERWRQTNRRMEAGGLLLGKLHADWDEITHATQPQRGDQRGPRHFVRSRSNAQPVVDAAWLQSGGRVQYLGEWHTHAESAAQPSSTDVSTIRQMLIGADMEVKHIYLIVIGTIVWWVGCQGKRRLLQIPRVEVASWNSGDSR